MYNLTVAEAHTFFVGDGQWLVHNITCPPGWTRGRPEPGHKRGAYKFEDTNKQQPYIGKAGPGNIRDRLYKHHKGKTPYHLDDYDNAIWLESEYRTNTTNLNEDEYYRTLERTLMYHESGGDLELLANREWPMNDPKEIAQMKEFFGNLPDFWPSEVPVPPKEFFKKL